MAAARVEDPVKKKLRLSSMFFLAMLFLLPLSFLLAPSPFSDGFARRLSSVHLLIAGYLLLSAAGVGFLTAKRSRLAVLALSYVPAAIFLYFLGSFLVHGIRPTTEVAGVLLGVVVFCIGVLFGCRHWFAVHRFAVHRSQVPGTAALLLTLNFFVGFALLLEVIPANALIKSIDKVPYLFDPIDQGHNVYHQHGFRGQWPCTDGCPDSFVRILTMGGSSTNGVPMVLGNRTYTAELQRILDERRIGEHYEVLNAGIAGHGIVQVYAALKDELLKYKPDVVAINLWFNDTAPAPGWYGIPGVSDMEGYQRARFLRMLQDLPVYREIRSTRVYAFLRHYLVPLREKLVGAVVGSKEKKTPRHRSRMRPDEYGKTLELIVALGKEHGFLPVFVTEPLNRSRPLAQEVHTNPYLAEMKRVAKAFDLPYVDTLTPLSRVRAEWLYYDFIHPNPQGHAIVADSIYRTLFFEPTERSKKFLSSRGVVASKPMAEREAFVQLAVGELPKEALVVKARAPMLAEASAVLVVSDESAERIRFPGLSSQWQEFSIPRAVLPLEKPIVDLYFRANVAAGAAAKRFAIGSSGFSSPVPLVVESGGKDYGWSVAIRVHNMRYDYNHRGYNIVVIGGQSGEILDTGFFDVFVSAGENQKLERFLDSATRHLENGVPPIVVIAVKTDGSHLADKQLLTTAFRKLGGSGALPEHFQSFLLIGVPGAKPGTAVEKVGPAFQRALIGDPAHAERSLIQLEIPAGQGVL